MLIKLGEYERDINGIIYKYHAYRKASQSLATMDRRVKSGDEAKKLPGIGPKIALKIDEFLNGNGDVTLPSTSQSSDNSKTNGKVSVSSDTNEWRIMDNYEKLYMDRLDAMRMQINQASTIGELNDKIDLLTEPQKICLRHFPDLCKKISRNEIETFAKYIKKVVSKINEHIQLTICGSYRRGANESECVEILMVHSKWKSSKSNISSLLADCLLQVVEALQKEGIVKERLSVQDHSFVGLAQVKTSPYRLIALHLAPKDNFVCQLFYLTGSRAFFDQIAQHALCKGFVLDKNSLRKIGHTCVVGQSIPLKSEEELFEYIDYSFVKPEERTSAA